MDEDWIFVQPGDSLSKEKLPQKPTRKLRYEPLEDNKNFIRVLVILPRESSSTLTCRLLQADLRKYNHFEALSYTWGNPIALNTSMHQSSPLNQGRKAWEASARRGTIVVDGVEVAVGANLRAALDRVALQKSRRVIWVDALCIDQDNLEERGGQVAIMYKIYEMAKRVLVWLGPHEDLWRRWTDLKIPKWLLPAFCALSSSWFQRVWVVQEAVMAREITLLIGSTEVPFGYLRKLAFEFPYNQGQEAEAEVWTEALNTSTFITSLRETPTRPELKEVVILARNKHCRDPRDRIYGLLALARNASNGEALLTPDYKLTLPQVYAQSTYSSIVGYNNLDVLLHVKHRNSDIRRPSWARAWDEADDIPTVNSDIETKELLVRMTGPTAEMLNISWPTLDPKPGLDCLSLPADIILEICREPNLGFEFKSHLPDCLTNIQEEKNHKWIFYLGKADSNFAICRGPASINELKARLCFTDDVSESLTEPALEKTWIKRVERPWAWVDDARYCECSLDNPMPGHRFLKRNAGWIDDVLNLDYKAAITRQDQLVFVPNSARPGDFIALLYGIQKPFVVRRALDIDSPRAYELIGPCEIESWVLWDEFEAQRDRLGWIEFV